uniref:MYND-type domain-containing protein n=1 Tax=Anopheles maculatus TaxID=74869 RepID=A0A182SKJ8_9DIPT
VSLIPSDDRKSVSNDVTAIANISNDSNDNDDVLIIEEEAGPSSVSTPSRRRKIDGTNQLPPPLVPRPPDASISSLPSDDDNMMELNRTMQLFDDSSNRVLDHIRTVMEDLLKDMSGSGSSLAELATLKLNQERQQELWLRDKEKQQHAFDSRLAELRVSLEQEKQRALNEQRQQLVREKQRAVQSTKLKQWCKKCFSEAHYYCCWNTSYCSAACQKKHWMEHQNDCTQDHANSARSVQPSATVTNSLVFSDSNNSSTTGSTNNSSSMRNRNACLQISAIPSYGSGGGDANNLLSKRSTNNRAFPGEITSTSTPLQTPVRFIPGAMTGNVSYKTPIIQSVHGRDSMIINLPSHSPQNGGNVTLGVATASTPQQLMQKRAAAARDKSIQLNNHKADSRNKGYTSRKTYDITSSPYQNTSNNLLTSTTSTIVVPSVASTYATVTLADTVTVSGASAGVWNQVAMLQASGGSRQLHSGTPFATAVGGGATVAASDATEKGFAPVELGIRSTHLTVPTSLAQQQKTVQQQPSIAYMRHQQ